MKSIQERCGQRSQSPATPLALPGIAPTACSERRNGGEPLIIKAPRHDLHGGFSDPRCGLRSRSTLPRMTTQNKHTPLTEHIRTMWCVGIQWPCSSARRDKQNLPDVRLASRTESPNLEACAQETHQIHGEVTSGPKWKARGAIVPTGMHQPSTTSPQQTQLLATRARIHDEAC